MSSLARPFRLTQALRIGELFDRGLRAGDSSLLVIGLPNDLDRTRVAMAVGKRAFGNAVHRNRIKRLCREAFRRAMAELPIGWDLVMVPRGGRTHTVDALAAGLKEVVPRLAAKSCEQTHEPPRD